MNRPSASSPAALTASRSARTRRGAGASASFWITPLVIVLAALGVRLALFNGLFGSDDVVYVQRAFDVAAGRWTSSNYNGALRYGFNLPAGAFVYLFGSSLAAVNLWPLLCSLVEIAATYAVASELAGRRTAACAAVLLATAPLHIAVASRVHADPVVSAFLTLSFACILLGLRRRSGSLLFAAGLCIGSVYWVKELVAVTFVAFLPLLPYFRRWPLGAARALTGAVLMVALNCALMAVIAGDPFHLIKVVTGAVARNFVQAQGGEDSPGYYLRYLWIDIRHVGLLGWLALCGAWLARPGRNPPSQAAASPGWGFIALWLFGLLLTLSVFPVSLSPLRFTMKQSNYLTLLLAPLALLAAFGLGRLPARASSTVLAVAASAGVLLGALQQADYRAFTANSKALAVRMQAQPSVLWIGSRNNEDLGALLLRLQGSTTVPATSFRETLDQPEVYRQLLARADGVMAVLDPQTAGWFAGPRHPPVDPLPCWQALGVITPAGLGLGNRLAGALADAAAQVPSAQFRRLADSLGRLAHPLPARIFAVPGRDVWCSAS